MIGKAPADDPELKGIGVSVFSVVFEILGKYEVQYAPVRFDHGHIQFLLEAVYKKSQSRTLMRAGASELQAGEAAAVHEASAAGGAQIVGKTQHLHRTEIHKGIVSDFPEKARQGQFHDVPVVPIPDLRSAEDAQFLSLRGRCSRGKRMILQHRDRQAEKLVRQDGFFIAGQRPQDGNAAILPPHGKPPVCQSAD